MAWNLACYGVEWMEETWEDHLQLLTYMAERAKAIPAYSGSYLNYYMGSVQFCLNVKRETDGRHQICGAESHNTDMRVWTCKVMSVLKSEGNPLMSKRVAVTGSDKSMAVVELINADILPSYDEGEEICFQVVAQGVKVNYYADEAQYERAEGNDIGPDHPVLEPGRLSAAVGSLLPVGFMSQHIVGKDGEPHPEPDPQEELLTCVTGRVKAFSAKKVELEGKLVKKYVSCLIDTPFGELPLVHDLDQIPPKMQDYMKPGAIVSAVCTLSGDMMIYEYEDGIVLNEENNLKLLRSAFNNQGQWPRLYPALAPDCHYLSEGSGMEITGREEIIRFLTEREKKLDCKELFYHSCYGTLSAPDCEASILAHKEGEQVILLWQGEKREYEAIVFLHTNEEGLVDDIHLCKDNRYRFRAHDVCPFLASSRKGKAPRYDGLQGKEFLCAYLRDHGVSEKEIELMDFWGFFRECYRLRDDREGMDYARRVTKKMIHYRGLSAEYAAEHPEEAPWYWPTAMKFSKFVWEPPVSNDDVWGVMECVYQGKCYMFGIGKREEPITEEMRRDGEWSIYTYSD